MMGGSVCVVESHKKNQLGQETSCLRNLCSQQYLVTTMRFYSNSYDRFFLLENGTFMDESGISRPVCIEPREVLKYI